MGWCHGWCHVSAVRESKHTDSALRDHSSSGDFKTITDGNKVNLNTLSPFSSLTAIQGLSIHLLNTMEEREGSMSCSETSPVRWSRLQISQSMTSSHTLKYQPKAVLCIFPNTSEPGYPHSPSAPLTAPLCARVFCEGGAGFQNEAHHYQAKQHHYRNTVTNWHGNELMGFSSAAYRHLTVPLSTKCTVFLFAEFTCPCLTFTFFVLLFCL